jgi:hypothetical protein
VKNAKNAILAIKNNDMPSNTQGDESFNDTNCNEFVISDISYINKNFQAKQKASQKLIDDTAKYFKLNKEQN